jgi:hypothetical protein
VQDGEMDAVAINEPWAFTQQPPLTTSGFCKEAERRGIRLNNGLLRELWRVGGLAPIAEVRNRRSGSPHPSPIAEPRGGGTWAMELRRARDTGHLIDPSTLGFRPQLRFEQSHADNRRRWWNGLIYSRWQMIPLDKLRGLLAGFPPFLRGGKAPRITSLSAWQHEEALSLRRLSCLLVALEARYLPEIKPPSIHLTNASYEEWDEYRRNFTPLDVVTRLGWTPEEVAKVAERLLIGLSRREPCQGHWSQLIRRAAYRAWDDFAGEALTVLDCRMAAEILLLCFDDMASGGDILPLADHTDWFSLDKERLSYAPESLDGNLSALGLSPHPGVVLVVEGETEELLIPRVRDRLQLTDDTGIVRSVVMRGTKASLSKLVAFAAGPLIERTVGDNWLLAKPPTRVFVAVDPDKPFDTPENAEAERLRMVDEIVAVVRAQGVNPEREDLDSLVHVETWTESCFEFAHFSDDELAQAIASIHPNRGGLSNPELAKALGIHRQHRQDVKHVWKRWSPRVSKRVLANALWPMLEGKIAAAQVDPDAPIPEVVLRLTDAHK